MPAENNISLSEDMISGANALAITVLDGFKLLNPFFDHFPEPLVAGCQGEIINIAKYVAAHLGSHHMAAECADAIKAALDSADIVQSVGKAEALTRIIASVSLSRVERVISNNLDEAVLDMAAQSPPNIEPLIPFEASIKTFSAFAEEATKHLLQKTPSGAFYPVEGAICQGNIAALSLRL